VSETLKKPNPDTLEGKSVSETPKKPSPDTLEGKNVSETHPQGMLRRSEPLILISGERSHSALAGALLSC